MPGDNIFAEDWRDCLRSHYLHVVGEQDGRTERTLRGVMHNVGFSDDELNELRVLATIHVDDVGADFTPDLNVLVTHDDAVGAQRAAPLPSEIPSDETVIDTDPVEEAVDEEPPQYDESGPQQIALF
jgi:hypothetical protein